MMRSSKLTIPLLIIGISLALGIIFINECSSGGGMGAAYRTCDCAGYEWLVYDRTPSDGQIKSLCFGIVRAVTCHQFIDGPTKECDIASKVTLITDREVYAVGDIIKLTLTNDLSIPIRYSGFCSLHLCRYQSDEWYCEIMDCYAETVVIEAGSSIELINLPSGLIGTRLKYRFEFRTFIDGTLYTIESNEFTIRQE